MKNIKIYLNTAWLIIALLTTFIIFVATSNSHKNPRMNYVYDKVKDSAVWVKLEPETRIDDYWNHHGKVYGGDYGDFSINDLDQFTPLTCDASSFEVARGTGYAKDDKHVYYPYYTYFVDTEIDGFGPVFEGYVVDGADPETFKYIGNGYGIDKNRMYLRGEEIPWDETCLRRGVDKEYGDSMRLNNIPDSIKSMLLLLNELDETE